MVNSILWALFFILHCTKVSVQLFHKPLQPRGVISGWKRHWYEKCFADAYVLSFEGTVISTQEKSNVPLGNSRSIKEKLKGKCLLLSISSWCQGLQIHQDNWFKKTLGTFFSEWITQEEIGGYLTRPALRGPWDSEHVLVYLHPPFLVYLLHPHVPSATRHIVVLTLGVCASWTNQTPDSCKKIILWIDTRPKNTTNLAAVTVLVLLLQKWPRGSTWEYW